MRNIIEFALTSVGASRYWSSGPDPLPGAVPAAGAVGSPLDDGEDCDGDDCGGDNCGGDDCGGEDCVDDDCGDGDGCGADDGAGGALDACAATAGADDDGCTSS
jgi:hypothetical protein